MVFCFDAAGRLLHVGRWNTLVSVLPINICVLVEPPDDDPPEELPDEDPPDDVPVPDPVLSIAPLGNVSIAPLVENTILPFLSVLYTETPAADNLFNASLVG